MNSVFECCGSTAVRRGAWLYLSMRVEDRQCGVQHAAPHLAVSVIQCVRHKEQEERGHLALVQVLRELVQRQRDSTPAHR